MEIVRGSESEKGIGAVRSIRSGLIFARKRKALRPPKQSVVTRFFLTSLAHYACSHYPVRPDLLKYTEE